MLLREVEHTKCSLGGTRGVWAPCGSRFWLAGCLQEGPPWRGARGLLLVRTVRDGVSTSPCADYLPGGTRAHVKGSQPRLAAACANRAPSAPQRCALPAFPQRHGDGHRGWEITWEPVGSVEKSFPQPPRRRLIHPAPPCVPAPGAPAGRNQWLGETKQNASRYREQLSTASWRAPAPVHFAGGAWCEGVGCSAPWLGA